MPRLPFVVFSRNNLSPGSNEKCCQIRALISGGNRAKSPKLCTTDAMVGAVMAKLVGSLSSMV